MGAAVLVLVLALLAACSTAAAGPTGDGSSTGSDGGTSTGYGGTGGGGGGGDGGGGGGDGGGTTQPSVAVRTLASKPVSYAGPCNGTPAAVTFSAEITGTPGTVVAFRWVDSDGSHGSELTTTLPSATDAKETSAKVKSVWARPAGGWPAPFHGARTIEITSPVAVTSTTPASFTINCKAPEVVKVVIEKISLKRLSPGGMCQVEVVVSDKSPTPVDKRTLHAEGSVKVIAPSHDVYGLLFDNGWWPAASDSGTYRATFPLANGYPVTFQISIKHGGVVVAGQGNNVGKFCG
jgi:hypothetical protein